MTTTGTSEIGGVPVWFTHTSAASDSPPVVLLHGGLSDTRVFKGMVDELAGPFDLWSYDRRAHGRTPDSGPDDPITFDSMLAEAVAFIEGVVDGGQVHLVGHSDGASLALLLAVTHPELVASVSAFSGNLDPSGMEPGKITPEELAEAVAPGYDEVAPDASRLPSIAARILRMWWSEPTMSPSDVSGILVPCLIAAAETDSIRRAHTELIAAAIPGARLAIVPETTHMLIEQDPVACAALVRALISGVPPRTAPA